MTITAYEIQATLAVADKATPQLERVLALSKGIAAEFERIKAAGAKLFMGVSSDRMAKSLGTLSQQMTLLAAKGNEVKALSGELWGLDKALGSGAEGARLLKTELAEAAAASKAIAATLKVPATSLASNKDTARTGASVDKLSAAMTKATAEAQKLQTSVVASFGEVDKAILASVDTARAFKTELAEAAAAAKAIADTAKVGLIPLAGGGQGGKGGGGKGGGHPGSSAHVGGTVPMGAGMHGRYSVGPSGSGVLMGTAAALGYGAYEEAKLRDTIAEILFTSGVPLTNNKNREQDFDAVRKILLDVTTGTGAHIGEIEEAALGLTRQMAGFPLNQRLAVFRTALEFGVQEHMLKGASVEEGTEALIGLLHQTGTYDPKLVNDMASSMAYTSLVSPLTLSQIARASSYAMPLLAQGLDVDKNELLLTMAAMQRAGVLSTKSGTWVNQGLTKEFVGTASMTSHASAKQREALKRLGLIDSHDKSTVIDKKGHLSLISLAKKLQEAKAHYEKLYGAMAGAKMVADQNQAFGIQGGRFTGMLSEPQIAEQLPELEAGMKRMPDAQQFFADMFDASTAQNARVALAEFNQALMDLGKDILPTVTPLIKGLDEALKKVNEAGPVAQGGAVAGGIIGGALTWAGLKKGSSALLDWIGKGAADVAERSGAKAAVSAGRAGLKSLTLGALDRLALPVAGGTAAHLAMDYLDPNASVAKWIDRNVPGAAWADNVASRIGLGLSYAEQGGQSDDAAPNPAGFSADMARRQRAILAQQREVDGLSARFERGILRVPAAAVNVAPPDVSLNPAFADPSGWSRDLAARRRADAATWDGINAFARELGDKIRTVTPAAPVAHLDGSGSGVPKPVYDLRLPPQGTAPVADADPSWNRDLGIRRGANAAPSQIDPANIEDLASRFAEAVAKKLNGTEVKLDGRAVGKLLMQMWVDETNKPLNGSSTFDSRFGFVAP